MAVKLGSFVIPGGSSFSVTGVGFKPRWAIFLFGNKGTEDTWLADACGGISLAAIRNSITDPNSFETCQISERWYDAGGVVAGSFLGDVTMWVRATNGSDGWAAYVASIDNDGWTFNFSVGFNSGAGGQRVYYLAGDEGWEEVACTKPFVPGSSPLSCGFQPNAFFGIGAGGDVGAPGNTQSFSLFNMSVPSVCYGDWGEYDDSIFGMNSQFRGILDPNVNVQSWFGYEQDSSPVTILEPTQAGGAWFSSTFAASRTDTTFTGSVAASGFGDGKARMMPFILGSVDSRIGEFTPTNTLAVPTFVDVGFTPEAVVFFSPQDQEYGVFSAAVEGATGWGFCTEDEEALLIYGGHWNPPNPFQSAMLISRNKCWVSSCIEGTGAIGSIVTAGSARVVPGGFEYTTTENAASVLFPILYWAIAPASEAPGFFRVVHR